MRLGDRLKAIDPGDADGRTAPNGQSAGARPRLDPLAAYKEQARNALFEQLEILFVTQQWSDLNLWVFLMVGLATTVSFVINTAQRTEILGWSMRQLKNDA